MCYLVAKKFDSQGCIAVKTKHSKALGETIEELNHEVGEKRGGVQIVTVSRPSAYGEYEPDEIVDSMENFKKKAIEMI